MQREQGCLGACDDHGRWDRALSRRKLVLCLVSLCQPCPSLGLGVLSVPVAEGGQHWLGSSRKRRVPSASSPQPRLPVRPHLGELESWGPVFPYPTPRPPHWVTSTSIAKWGKSCQASLPLSLGWGQVICSASGSTQRTASTGSTCPWSPATEPRPLPSATADVPTHTRPTLTSPAHVHDSTVTGMCGVSVYLCCTNPSTATDRTGRTPKLHNSGGSPVWEHRQPLCAPPGTRTYTLLHGTHTETRRHTEASVECACTPVHASALGHKRMLLYTWVSPGPARPQSYSGPGLGPMRSETASSQQAAGTVSPA